MSKLSGFRPQKSGTGYKITGGKETVSWLVSPFGEPRRGGREGERESSKGL